MPTPDPTRTPAVRGHLPPQAGGEHPALAGGTTGPDQLRPLLDTVLDALTEGATARRGPIPPGGPQHVTSRLRHAATPVLPETGTGAEEALHTLVRALAEGSADPAEPHCAGHLHCPPLALAVAADLAACALNPSMDSWDQAPAASALETDTATALAALVYPGHSTPDALVTTGGTDSNHLALLLARERARATGAPATRIVCATTTHHSIHRAAWLLGLPEPVILPAPDGTLDPAALDTALSQLHGPVTVVATAGTTDTGAIDPLPRIADVTTAHAAELHIDASYGGPLLLSNHHRHLLDGIQNATTVTLDLHKLGWQPIAAGLLAVPDTTALRPLHTHADYLNAHDDTDAGIPDLLGRSLRTTRRPDILKIAVTLRALGRQGLGDLIDRICRNAQYLADLIDQHPHLTLHARPTISTVLFRPTHATDAHVAAIRRTLITNGTAVLGRAHTHGRLWLKATLLNPATHHDDLTSLLKVVAETATAPQPEGTTPR
ncbi:aminotransferase class V-fold PLP-dependent enzyme [Streptomyces sp. RB6PN25]|uniref:Aminotransferase class V-fold PLP-dependent enzyme n=1 Tax=Streptomyces humicola TaxID=2953240 RepID=A0ABT1PUW5_9ACTN|nr:pyridoxal-dependent decarboxylase [Streptomyces humicola]MCQ4081465.1 aminotransferase class V-fold PLP-dependent enzyme [Streptomyces humicola]